MGIGFKELLIILAIALLIFGAKRLKTIGSDLGGAVKGFKKAMDEGDDKESQQLNSPDAEGRGFRFDAVRRQDRQQVQRLRRSRRLTSRQARCSKSASPRSS